MPFKRTKGEGTEISLVPMSQGELTACLIGITPLIFNQQSEKVKRYLLLPGRRKNEAEKAATVKHDPLLEYRAAVYCHADDHAKTRLRFPASAFKSAMGTAALDLPGVKSTEIDRLVTMMDEYVDVFGVPEMFIKGVRSADVAHTPDMRTRAILRNWCCIVRIKYGQPKLNAKTIGALLATGGITAGVGDWRQEKGSASYGQFRICNSSDEDFKAVIANGGRKVQDAALTEPPYYDEETEALFTWYMQEIVRRGTESDDKPKRPVLVDDAAPAKPGRGRRKQARFQQAAD